MVRKKTPHVRETSPGKCVFFLSIYLPYLPYAVPGSFWTSACMAALSLHTASYMISVRQTGDLLASSFRFHLSMDTLEVHYYLPAAGRFRDFHLLDYSHAERTIKTPCKILHLAECFFRYYFRLKIK